MTDKHLDTPIGSPGKIRTFLGRLVDPFNLQPSEVEIEDIAHSLSQLCRFTGHTRVFYSVGEHCLLVASMLPGPLLQLAGLVHDAGEAYFGDMAGPLKRRLDMGEYNTAEHRAAHMIMQKFCGDLTPTERKQVKAADAAAYHIERQELIRPGHMEAYEYVGLPKLGTMSMTTVEQSYLNVFYHLIKQIK